MLQYISLLIRLTQNPVGSSQKTTVRTVCLCRGSGSLVRMDASFHSPVAEWTAWVWGVGAVDTKHVGHMGRGSGAEARPRAGGQPAHADAVRPSIHTPLPLLLPRSVPAPPHATFSARSPHQGPRALPPTTAHQRHAGPTDEPSPVTRHTDSVAQAACSRVTRASSERSILTAELSHAHGSQLENKKRAR